MKCCWWICLWLLAAAPVSALEVQQVKWGFDGQVVPARFNLLSVLVANPSAAPFDGTVNLYKGRGLEERVGAVYRSPCYLSPLTTRWLQFYVYMDNQYDQWRLQWGRAPEDHFDVQSAKWGRPAQVLLSSPENLLSPAGAGKSFPEELFPPTAAAASGLDSVLLDHVPHWEPAKRQAFLDWLRAGGKVHLLEGADGRYPTFSDELGVLNISGDRARLGAGLVVRHAATAREIRKQDTQEGDAPPEAKPGSPTRWADLFLRALSGLSQRRYSWPGIYALAILYVALVGPGNLAAGRRLADYRLRIVLLLATIAGFAFLFNLVGRRGQGESSVVHSLAYARAIDGDTYVVMQWVNVFIARGSQYTITHAAPHNLYATGQDYEAVNGWIESGRAGKFVVDLPMFSHRGFLHAAEMKGARIPVNIVSWDGAETPKRLVVSVGPDFTRQLLAGWVVQGDQVYRMHLAQDGLEFRDDDKQSLETFVSSSGFQPLAYSYGQPNPSETADVQGQFLKLAQPLVAWGLGADDFTQPEQSIPAAPGRVQLFLFARCPPGFCLTSPGLGHEIGYALYHFDLFKPGTGGEL